jgi:hypothetical protein
MKKTTVDLSGPVIKVSVDDGTSVLTHDIPPALVDEVVKDLKIERDAATQFLITYVGCTLRNVGDDKGAEVEFLKLTMEALKERKSWAMACVKTFSRTLLPMIGESVKKAKAAGQDPVTVISVEFELPMDAAKSFAACAELKEQGMSDEKIEEALIEGITDQDPEELAKKSVLGK